MDPLRLDSFMSGPPPAMDPSTLRLVTVPCADAPITLTDPDPVVASSVSGTEAIGLRRVSALAS